MFLDDKHYEQDVYDPEGEFSAPTPAAQPAPMPESPEAQANRALNRNFARLGLFVVGCGAAWFIPAVGKLVFCFCLAIVTMVMLFVAIGVEAWFIRMGEQSRRIQNHYHHYSYEMERSDRRESYVWATIFVVGVFVLGMVKLFGS